MCTVKSVLASVSFWLSYYFHLFLIEKYSYKLHKCFLGKSDMKEAKKLSNNNYDLFIYFFVELINYHIIHSYEIRIVDKFYLLISCFIQNYCSIRLSF